MRDIIRSGVTFQQSGLLPLPHGFSTRLGGVSRGSFSTLNLGHTRGDDPAAVRENFRRFCGALGVDMDRMVFSHQVHRDDVRMVTAADAGRGLDRERNYEADALITDTPRLPLVIFSADCIPVLLYDPVRRVVGAVHAGWRGTALGIAAKAVSRMGELYGCRPADIRAAIGPGISQCCFITDSDVPETITGALGAAARPCIDMLPGGKFRVDLKSLNRIWLEMTGVTALDISEDCTCHMPEKYFSHRRTGSPRGSLAAIIMLPE